MTNGTASSDWKYNVLFLVFWRELMFLGGHPDEVTLSLVDEMQETGPLRRCYDRLYRKPDLLEAFRIWKEEQGLALAT